jgi:Leucine-rich repeat (LRR) protein
MLTYKEIELICNVPKPFHNITKLYLSNNSISSLTGIDVFKNLAYFSISHNFIERFEELLKISHPDKIVSLSVKGNYFCKNPQSNLLIIQHFNK